MDWHIYGPFVLQDHVRDQLNPGRKMPTHSSEAGNEFNEDQKAPAIYRNAAQTILRRTPDARSSVDKSAGGASVPLPQKRQYRL